MAAAKTAARRTIGPLRAYVVCIDNRNYRVSLQTGKVYRLLRDPKGASAGLVRVVDETGEDYLYPQRLFSRVRLSRQAAEALRAAVPPTADDDVEPRLKALTKLQRSLKLTPSKARAWADRAKRARRAWSSPLACDSRQPYEYLRNSVAAEISTRR
ncbi:MAG: hypothetical protein HYU41_07315 [Candidatus Rokubacteria bacterium]|nr:hypothetical protein [Candidatus Rokubacteria bacterium]